MVGSAHPTQLLGLIRRPGHLDLIFFRYQAFRVDQKYSLCSNTMFQKILIAIGDSTTSEEILKAGLMIAEKCNAQILLLHVMNPLTPHGFETIASPLVGGILPIIDDATIRHYLEEWKEYGNLSSERLQAYAQKADEHGIKNEILQSFGDSGPMICDAAKKWSADLIVMGRNQKSVLNELFLGSTSNYILHKASCSTMVIHLPELII
jgi:nucleotide-binding universal stress UspA family protein